MKQTIPTFEKRLGGFIAEGNISTFAGDTWDFIIENFNITSMLDVGCGAGHTVKYFLDKGIDSYGVEGFPTIEEYAVVSMGRIIVHDYEKDGPYIPHQQFDFIWSCEFVEHVKESYRHNFLKTFNYCNYLGITHAVKGQGGFHHVNENSQEYWIKNIEPYGFVFDQNMTKQCKEQIKGKNYGKHVKDTFLFFRKIL